MRRASLGLGFLIAASAFCGGCDDRVTLVTVSSEKEANRILVALFDRARIHTAGKSVETRKQAQAWKILVEPGDVARARRWIVGLDLPSNENSGFESMLEHTGLIPTKTDEQVRLMYALGTELAKTLEVDDRIVKARVHIVLPGRDPLGVPDKASSASAAVLIKYLPTVDIAAGVETLPDAEPTQVSPASVEDATFPDIGGESSLKDLLSPAEIRAMVAGSVEGLAPSAVTVSYTEADVLSSGACPSDETYYVASRTPTLGESIVGGIALVEGLALSWLILLLRREVSMRRHGDEPTSVEVG